MVPGRASDLKTSKTSRAPTDPKRSVYSSKIKRSLSANPVCSTGNPPPPPAQRVRLVQLFLIPTFSHLASRTRADQTRSLLPLPGSILPPPSPLSSPASPGGRVWEERISARFPRHSPTWVPSGRSLRTAAPPPALPLRPHSQSRTQREEARAAGAEPPRRSSQAAPRAALGRAPACSWGIHSAGRIRARESSSPDSSCKQKPQFLLPPPPHDAHREKHFSAEMQQVAPVARAAPCSA